MNCDIEPAMIDAIRLLNASGAYATANRLGLALELFRGRADRTETTGGASDEFRERAAPQSRWPNSKIKVSALMVSTEIVEEDEGDPRMIEVRLSRESPGLIVLQGVTRSDQSIAFFVEQWASLREAVNTVAAMAET